jgi:hypothetical protein
MSNDTPKSVGWIVIVSGLAVLVVGGIWTYQRWNQDRAVRASANWPSAKATIRDVHADMSHSVVAGGDVARFSYMADGKYFIAEARVDRDSNGRACAEHDGKLVWISPGLPARCYYNPADPSVAVLTPGSSNGALFMMRPIAVALGGFVIIGKGLSIARPSRSPSAKKNPAPENAGSSG